MISSDSPVCICWDPAWHRSSRGVLHEACLDLMRATNSLHKSQLKFSYTTAFVVQACQSLSGFRRPLQRQIAQTVLLPRSTSTHFGVGPYSQEKAPQVTPSKGPSSKTGVIPRQVLCPGGKCSSFLVMHRTADFLLFPILNSAAYWHFGRARSSRTFPRSRGRDRVKIDMPIMLALCQCRT